MLEPFISVAAQHPHHIHQHPHHILHQAQHTVPAGKFAIFKTALFWSSFFYLSYGRYFLISEKFY